MKCMSFDHELHGPSAYSVALQPDVTELVLATQNSIPTAMGTFHLLLESPGLPAWDSGSGICRGNKIFFLADPLRCDAYF